MNSTHRGEVGKIHVSWKYVSYVDTYVGILDTYLFYLFEPNTLTTKYTLNTDRLGNTQIWDLTSLIFNQQKKIKSFNLT